MGATSSCSCVGMDYEDAWCFYGSCQSPEDPWMGENEIESPERRAGDRRFDRPAPARPSLGARPAARSERRRSITQARGRYEVRGGAAAPPSIAKRLLARLRPRSRDGTGCCCCCCGRALRRRKKGGAAHVAVEADAVVEADAAADAASAPAAVELAESREAAAIADG